MSRVDDLRRRLPDARGGKVVFVSHCLLNQNVRYLGGATRAGGIAEVVDAYLHDDVGICQLPCPEQRAWGGVLKRRMLVSYGSGGTWRAPLTRLGLRPFMGYTRWRYARLARTVARDIADYRRCGMQVVAVVGVSGSPSCGVRSSVDMYAAAQVNTRCPLARLDREFVNDAVVAANVRPGAGMFVSALRRALARRGTDVRWEEHDLMREVGVDRRPAQSSPG